MRKKLIIGGIIGLALILISIFAVGKIFKSEPKSAMDSLPTLKVERGIVEKTVFAQGVVREIQEEEVNAEIRTTVTGIMVREGDRVEAGQLLFTLEDGESRLALEQEELGYRSTARELDKANAAADTEAVRATVDGGVVKLLVSEGDKVEDNTVVAELSNQDFLEVVAPFGPVGVNKLKAGQKARIFLMDHFTYLEGEIVRVDQRGKANKNGGIVHNVTVKFANPGAVSLGSMASVEITVPGSTLLTSLETGEVRAGQTVKVKAGSSGTVLELAVSEGENVKKNELLARLDISEARLVLQERRMSAEQAKKALDIKRNQLNRYRVCAGQDGVVTEINITKGQLLPPDKPAMVISGVQGLELLAKVDESDIPVLRIGQEASVYANAFGDKRFPGEITKIALRGKAEGSSVVFEANIKIKESGLLRAGMTGDVDVVVEKKEGVLRLPVNSLIIEGRKGTVMVPGPEGPKPKAVSIGIEGDEYVEITGGLSEGDRVLVNPRQPV